MATHLLTFRLTTSANPVQKGSLAVPEARSIVDRINRLLELPWGLRVATLDWHPQNHVSFASNHGSNHRPLQQIEVKNPLNPSETQPTTLWPDHCVQNTAGAALIPELNQTRIDHVVKKGQDSRVEMISAFRDAFKSPCVATSDLASILRSASIRKVFVVGLARDYCVKETALDAAGQGFETTVLAEATKAIDESAKALSELTKTFSTAGIQYATSAEVGLI